MAKRKAENPTVVPLTGERVTQVKNCIEQCMMRYMTKRGAKEEMQKQHNIDPCLTDIVWNLLEHSHKDFFVRYYQKLKAIELIEDFNRLLAKHIAATERYGFINGEDELKKPSNGVMEKNKAPMVMPENTQIGPSSNPWRIETPIGSSSRGNNTLDNIGSSSNPWIQTHIGSSSHGNNTHDSRRVSLNEGQMNGIVHPSKVEMPALYDNSQSNMEMPALYDNSHSNGSRRVSLDVGQMNGVIHQSNVQQSTVYTSQNPQNNSTPQSGMGYNTESTVLHRNGSVYARGTNPNFGSYEPRNTVNNGNAGYYGLPQDFYDPSPMHENGNRGNTANSSWQQQPESRHEGPSNFNRQMIWHGSSSRGCY